MLFGLGAGHFSWLLHYLDSLSLPFQIYEPLSSYWILLLIFLDTILAGPLLRPCLVNLYLKLVLLLCWKQVKQVSRSTSMSHTAQSMRSSLICLDVPKRTVASWRDPRESAACCGRSWNAGCWVVRLSTSLSIESQDHTLCTQLQCEHSTVATC